MFTSRTSHRRALLLSCSGTKHRRCPRGAQSLFGVKPSDATSASRLAFMRLTVLSTTALGRARAHFFSRARSFALDSLPLGWHSSILSSIYFPERVIQRHQRRRPRGEDERRDLHLLLGLLALRGLESLAVSILHDGKLPDMHSRAPSDPPRAPPQNTAPPMPHRATPYSWTARTRHHTAYDDDTPLTRLSYTSPSSRHRTRPRMPSPA
mgnify:CR=1 FL=1